METRRALILVSAVLLLSDAAAITCKTGWVSFQDSCYYFSHGVATWAEAGSICRMLHSHLALTETAAVVNFVKSELSHRHPHDYGAKQYWLDGTDLETEHVWKWTETSQVLSYTDWAPGEPNFGNSDNCLNMWGLRGFRFADNNCEEHYNYICQTRTSEETEILG